jgi:Uma2 family endonuclease
MSLPHGRKSNRRQGDEAMAVGISSAESPTLVAENGSATGTESAPLSVPDDGLYEVIDGKIVEKDVGAQQAEIAGLVTQIMGPFARTHRLGRVIPEMVYRIDPVKNLQRRPDVSFVSDAKWPSRKRVPNVPVWDMVPDLAIEIVSPNNTADQVQDKRLEYFQAGVRQVWVIYPRQREAHVYTATTSVTILTAGQELDGGDLLPGFRLPLSALFEDEPEAG